MNANESSKTYVRRRAFNKIHVTSWLIYLEKDGFVRCPFQNCNFMAFDVEEMCNHFGYCKGDSNKYAKFECEHCHGRTDTLKKLQLHLLQAHNIGMSSSSEAPESDNVSDPTATAKPSKVLMVSWTCFFDKNNYVKCQTCNYLANTLADMCRHYKVCKQELAELLYVCPVCKGRTMNVNPLLWHLEKSHKIFKAPSQFNHLYKAMITFWQKELEENKLACCLHALGGKRDCCFFDVDLIGIIEHSQTCKGPQFHYIKEECPCCPKWTNSKDKLNQHIAFSHLNNLSNFKIRPFEGNLDEDFMQKKFKKSKQSSSALETDIKESDVMESSLLNENKTPLLYVPGEMCDELSTLLPESSTSNQLKILDKALESNVDKFHEVVIPPSLYAKAPKQENNMSDVVNERTARTSVNNHCKISISDKNMEEIMHISRKEFNRLHPPSNKSVNITTKSQVNDPDINFIKEEIVTSDDEGITVQDLVIRPENRNRETINTEVVIKTDEDLTSNYKDSSLQENEEFQPEATQGPCSSQNHFKEKQPNIIADLEASEDIIDGKRKRSYCTLFKDDTSDEEDSLALDGGFQTRVTMSFPSENSMNKSNELHEPSEDSTNQVLSKNYLRRPKPVKSVRCCSPTENSSTVTSEVSFNSSLDLDDDVSRTVSFIIEKVASLLDGSTPSKTELSKTQVEIHFENHTQHSSKLPNKISKSSEKNDKLLIPIREDDSKSSDDSKSQMSASLLSTGNVQAVGIHYKYSDDSSSSLNYKNNTICGSKKCKTSEEVKESLSNTYSSPNIHNKQYPQVLDNISKEQTPGKFDPILDTNNMMATIWCSNDKQTIKNSKNTLSKTKTTIVLDSEQKLQTLSETTEVFDQDSGDAKFDISRVGNYSSAYNHDEEHNVTFLYEGKLNKSFISMSSVNESDEETEENIVISSSNTNQNNDNESSDSQINNDNVRLHCIPFLKICCQNDGVSRYETSYFYNESCQDKEFIGTDEEPDMEDNLFNGFQDIADTKSRSKKFKLFLSRLSESENEEWFVNAGNLDMNMRKQEDLPRSKIAVNENDQSLKDESFRLRKYPINNVASSCEIDQQKTIENVGQLKNKIKLPSESNLSNATIISVDKIISTNGYQIHDSETQTNDIQLSKTKSLSPIKKKRGRPPKKVDQLGVEEMEKYVEDIKQKVINTLRKEKKNKDLAVGINNKSNQAEQQYNNVNKNMSEPHTVMPIQIDIDKNNTQFDEDNVTDSRDTMDFHESNSLENQCNLLSVSKTEDDFNVNLPKKTLQKSFMKVNKKIESNIECNEIKHGTFSEFQCKQKIVKLTDNNGQFNNNEQNSSYEMDVCKTQNIPLKIKANQECKPIIDLAITFENMKDDIEDEISLKKLSEIYKTDHKEQQKCYSPIDENEHLISVFSDDAEILLKNIELQDSKIITIDKLTTNVHIVENPIPISVNIRRKRGRPPKIQTNQNSSVVNTSLSKSSFDSNNATASKKKSCKSRSNCKSVNLKYISQQPRKIKETHLNNVKCSMKHSDIDNKPIPKRRGRPPKSKIEQTIIETVSFNDPSPKRRGRPPKNKPDINNSTANIDGSTSKLSFVCPDAESSITTHLNSTDTLKDNKDAKCLKDQVSSKRRRGRVPKRRFSEDVSIGIKNNALNKSVSIVKKRGRKRKISIPNITTETVYADKDMCTNIQNNSPDNENAFSSISTSYPTPKRRGRPPKVVLKCSRGRPLGEARTSALVDKNKGCHIKKTVEEYAHEDPSCSSELLGTDIIVINKEKLNCELVSSVNNKKRQCKSNIVSYDLSSDEELVENRLNLTKKNKSKKPEQIVSSDEYTDNNGAYDDADNNSDCDPPIKKKGRFTSKKSIKPGHKTTPTANKWPVENSFFRVKHALNDEVVCGACKEPMNYANYRNNHALTKHYMLCWLDGEESPFDMSDAKEVVNRLWIAKKKLGKTPFRCSICNIPKLSAVGFQSHIQFCGKEHSEKISLLVTCEICGAKMMPASLKPHIYMKHKREPENSPTIDTQLIVPKMKRAAASRAVEVIHSQKEEEKEQESHSRAVSPDTKQYLAHLYIKPNRTVSNELFAKWKTSLKETNVAKCTFPGCDFSTESTCSIRRHYITCPFGAPRLYKCRNCAFTSSLDKEMQDHIIEKHEDIVNDIHSSEYESSDGGDEDESLRIRYSHYTNSLPFKFLKSSYVLRRHGSINRFFFPEAFKWTLKMRKDSLSDVMLFGEFEKISSKWTPLTQDMIPQYAPQERKSVQFKGSGNTWYTLRCFEATLLDGVPMMFAGGPVWAAAWAPVPDTETQQFLAVATHPTMERTHEMSAVYNYNSLIQIWNVGFLTNLEHSGETPKFLLGLAHGRGAVWALCWCPSGCYQDSRLGLLAASCSDGSIAIYSIPRYRQSFEYTMYKADPVIELKLGCEMLSQCTCMEWSSLAPHNTIVGGFANGMVAIWDLSTTSELLRDGITIYPYRVIEAHLSSVTAVCISDKLLMTASLDRATKFWHLDDSIVPVNTLRKASVMDAVMPSHWLTTINAYDDVYSMNSSHVTGYNFRETYSSNNTNFLLQPGTVWSLSFNDWLNACACASELGKLSVFFRQQLLVTEDSKKVKKGCMISDALAASVQPLNSWSNTENFGPKYSDCVSNIGLQFSFKSQFNESSRPKPGCSSDTMDSYPILAINKVTWNPNLHSFSWMAAGMQCGLVLVPHIRSITGWNFSELYKNLDRHNSHSTGQ